MSDAEMKNYYRAFSSCWLLFRKYAAVDDPKDKTYWSQLIEEASRLNESEPTRLTKNLVNAILKELEEIANESRIQ